MVRVLLQMGVLILWGAAWRIIKPAGLDAAVTRHVLTTLVFNLLMPALVLTVLWEAELGLDSLKLSLYGMAIIFFGALLAFAIGRIGRVARPRRGAAMLGIAFANVTFMGLPLLEHLYGPWARTIVVHLDIFASLPLVLTFGLIIARQHGTPPKGEPSLLRPFLINPPLWAACIALALNLAQIPQPDEIRRFLEPLADAVAPLMLMSVGLSLQWSAWRRVNLPLGMAVVGAKMLLAPLFGLGLAWLLGFRGDTLTAVVLESAMPSMLFGVVYCDRYRLDGAFYALAVLMTALAGTVTLPLWHGWLTQLDAAL